VNTPSARRSLKPPEWFRAIAGIDTGSPSRNQASDFELNDTFILMATMKKRNETETEQQHPLKRAFGTFASAVASAAGSPAAFTVALVSLIVWAISGPLFDYSEAWQLVINTGTTIVTFMMVFVIQNSQNRESLAVQIKLDELIRASGAKNSMIDLECLSEEELAELRVKFAEIADEARKDEKAVERKQVGVKHRRKVTKKPLNA
jgi:low affinity Fe/Cu permease